MSKLSSSSDVLETDHHIFKFNPISFKVEANAISTMVDTNTIMLWPFLFTYIDLELKWYNISLTLHSITLPIIKSFFSVVVLKHTISKRNKLLSCHKNLTRITSLITNVWNFDWNMISQSFYFLHFSFR